ncbi:MAG TPA: hypothetical protein VKH18_04110 [Terriglobales bacterium]|nr:hypothetical protein [Terriglobales bacterium]
MSHEDGDILEILRFELKFLEEGGYACSPRTPWRAPYIFEDSPSCLNFEDSTRPHPCNECLLTQFVPAEFREEEAPCRFIPLNDKGRTVDSLYRTGTHAEIAEALRDWLRREISRIETERTQSRAG